MNLQEAVDQIRQAMKDTSSDTAKRRRSDAVLVAKLNIAQRRWVRHIKAFKRENTLTLTAASGTASLPTDFLCFDESDMIGGEGAVILNYVTLQYRPVGWLDKHSSGWRNASSSTPDSWHLKDFSTVRFSCPLSTTAAAYTCTIRYIRLPATLSAESMTTDLLEGVAAFLDFHDDIVAWVIARCKREDGLAQESQIMEAMWRGDWEAARQSLTGMLNVKGQFRADPRWTPEWGQPPE